ncbi:pseudouridine synthase [Mesonia sp. HuA40]|uniref:pseudouridine synthase n=1 Tax=Mesonia sp. HuA40 TaxID=2602761 RepID=UPI0011CAF415|nr:pseudouridine synthase [Mesonia sp. HuA40]TXK75279.1 pseudouridine synthase [Mesonia sp. HuA40]
MSDTPQGKRINKFLSEAGFCSRRKADELIAAGVVTINGRVPEMGTKVLPEDQVAVNGKIVVAKEKPVYLAFHKPVGIVCTTDTRVEKNNVIDYINYPTRIFPIGRLDKPSEGLLLLTNDGDIVNKILRSNNNHGKEYQVKVNRPVTQQFIKRMANGIPILGTVTKKCHVKKTGSHDFEIVLTQGLNRQIRRMCEYLGYQVVQLKRTRIINIPLDVPVGKYRELTHQELNDLQTILKNSKKTHSRNK